MKQSRNEDDDDEISHDNQWSTNIIKNVAAVSIFLSAISALSNTIIFSILGLNFALIASPTDILIGGMQVLKTTFLIFLTSGCTVILWMAFQSKISKFQDSDLFLLVFVVILLILIALCYYEIFVLTRLIEYNSVIFTTNKFSFILPGLLSLLTFLYLSVRGKLNFFAGRGLLPAVFALAILVKLGGAAAEGQGDFVIDGSSTRCADTEHVVWAGSQYLVTTCSGPPYTRKLRYFVIDRNGLVIRTLR